MILNSQHDAVFHRILGYMSLSKTKLNTLRSDSISVTTFRPPRLEIPTAVLIAGVNMPDHDVLFQRLKVMVRGTITQHVVCLKSTSCTSELT